VRKLALTRFFPDWPQADMAFVRLRKRIISGKNCQWPGFPTKGQLHEVEATSALC